MDGELKELFEQGLKNRREMIGDEYVDKALENATDFNMAFQELATEWVWGWLWNREGLSRRERILINLAILSATNMPHEVRLYTKIAEKFGMSREDVREVFLHTACYSGVPRGLEAFRIATEVYESGEKL